MQGQTEEEGAESRQSCKWHALRSQRESKGAAGLAYFEKGIGAVVAAVSFAVKGVKDLEENGRKVGQGQNRRCRELSEIERK